MPESPPMDDRGRRFDALLARQKLLAARRATEGAAAVDPELRRVEAQLDALRYEMFQEALDRLTPADVAGMPQSGLTATLRPPAYASGDDGT